ncbi:hypothetical protein AHF37_11435 [Paragonimus kellicotti]|nr:hypothetical protein AHF37_11435 [Paragonimus kellicotti]
MLKVFCVKMPNILIPTEMFMMPSVIF